MRDGCLAARLWREEENEKEVKGGAARQSCEAFPAGEFDATPVGRQAGVYCGLLARIVGGDGTVQYVAKPW